jgi:hypothetical protein
VVFHRLAERLSVDVLVLYARYLEGCQDLRFDFQIVAATASSSRALAARLFGLGDLLAEPAYFDPFNPGDLAHLEQALHDCDGADHVLSIHCVRRRGTRAPSVFRVYDSESLRRLQDGASPHKRYVRHCFRLVGGGRAGQARTLAPEDGDPLAESGCAALDALTHCASPGTNLLGTLAELLRSPWQPTSEELEANGSSLVALLLGELGSADGGSELLRRLGTSGADGNANVCCESAKGWKSIILVCHLGCTPGRHVSVMSRPAETHFHHLARLGPADARPEETLCVGIDHCQPLGKEGGIQPLLYTLAHDFNVYVASSGHRSRARDTSHRRDACLPDQLGRSFASHKRSRTAGARARAGDSATGPRGMLPAAAKAERRREFAAHVRANYPCPCSACGEAIATHSPHMSPVGPQQRYGCQFDLLHEYMELLGLVDDPDAMESCRKALDLSVCTLDLECDTRRTSGPSPPVVDRVASAGNLTTIEAEQTLVYAGYSDELEVSGGEVNFHYRCFSVLPLSVELGDEPDEVSGDSPEPDDLLLHEPGLRLVARLVRHMRQRREHLQRRKERLLEPVYSRLRKLESAHVDYYRSQGLDADLSAHLFRNGMFGKCRAHVDKICQRSTVFGMNSSRYDHPILWKKIAHFVYNERYSASSRPGFDDDDDDDYDDDDDDDDDDADADAASEEEEEDRADRPQTQPPKTLPPTTSRPRRKGGGRRLHIIKDGSCVKRISFDGLVLTDASDLVGPGISLSRLGSLVQLESCDKMAFPFGQFYAPEYLRGEGLPDTPEGWRDSLTDRLPAQETVDEAVRAYQQLGCRSRGAFLQHYLKRK